MYEVLALPQTKGRDRDSRDYYKAKVRLRPSCWSPAPFLMTSTPALQFQQQLIADTLKTKEGEAEEQRKRIRELEGR